MAVVAQGAAILGADTRTLAQQQSDAQAALQKAKATALASIQYTTRGATYTVTLDTQDQVDVSTQLQLLTAQGSGATCTWEIVDGVFLTWAASDLQALYQAGMAHVQACYANAASLSAEIAGAAAADQLPDVTQGWPA